MTKKKRRPVKSIEKLSDDLKGTRALKGDKQFILVMTKTIDRWIGKAEALERRVDHWNAPEEGEYPVTESQQRMADAVIEDARRSLRDKRGAP